MVVDAVAAREELDKWKSNWKKEAERILVDIFPVKVLEVDKLLNSQMFRASRASEIRTVFSLPPLETAVENDQATPLSEGDLVGATSLKQVKAQAGPPAVVNYGPVGSNAQLIELINLVKPIVQEIVENVNKVKMWIMLLIPKVEDGNNFGVQIQEEALNEARIVELEASSFMDVISRYLLTRGKMVCKCVKYPHAVDFQQAVRDIDEKAFVKMRQVLIGVRNHYSSLHDMILKNIKKIKTPRTREAEHLY